MCNEISFMRQTNNNRIDIVKALAIILMVYGHTFGVFRNFVYLFHMPVFYIISGYVFKHKHASSKLAFREYFFDRAKRLMVPYYLTNVAFILLHNVFILIGFYTENPDILLANVGPIEQYVAGKLDWKHICWYSYHVLLNEGGGQLTGSTWFLYTLFMVSVIHCYLLSITKRIENNNIKKILWLMLFIILLGASWAISEGFLDDYLLPRHRNIPVAYCLFLMGVFLKDIDVRWDQYGIYFVGFISVCVLIYIRKYGTLELSQAKIINPLFLVVSSLSGWILLNVVSEVISHYSISRYFVYLGSNTLPILLIHMASFKLASYFFVLIRRLPSYMVASYTIIFSVSEFGKLLYVLVGVCVPLYLNWIYKKILTRVKKKEVADL